MSALTFLIKTTWINKVQKLYSSYLTYHTDKINVYSLSQGYYSESIPLKFIWTKV